MEQVKLPFRADIVGSFLRPERLKKARKDFESGLLSPAALQQIEDEEIEKLIAEQKVVLTSSLRTPKFFVKEFSYFLMPCHQHGLRINLLVQR